MTFETNEGGKITEKFVALVASRNVGGGGRSDVRPACRWRTRGLCYVSITEDRYLGEQITVES
jgi:hypothetical protein